MHIFATYYNKTSYSTFQTVILILIFNETNGNLYEKKKIIIIIILHCYNADKLRQLLITPCIKNTNKDGQDTWRNTDAS